MSNDQTVKPEPESGNITVILDGEEVVLKPSLRACMGISKMDSAPLVTANRVGQMDFDACLNVLAYGLGVAPDKRLQEKLYRTGLLDLRSQLIIFIHIVNNGGKPLSDDEDDKKDEEGENENPPVPSH